MRSSYKHPLIWVPVAVGLVLALVGRILTITIHSDWKYLFYDVTPGGLMIAGIFALCALANFLGTRFCVDKEFVKVLPSQIIVSGALIGILSFFAVLFFGIENKVALWTFFVGVSILALSFPVSCFIRGMTPPTENDR